MIIAGAGGAAHLPGMVASLATVPVIGVPIESKKLKGLDSLLSIVQMPKDVQLQLWQLMVLLMQDYMLLQLLVHFDSKIKSNLEKWNEFKLNQLKKNLNNNKCQKLL